MGRSVPDFEDGKGLEKVKRGVKRLVDLDR